MSGDKTGMHVYLACTPNGNKVSIALQELGLPHTLHKVDLAKGEQKEEDFLAINPAGRIPVLVDYDARPGGFTLSESGAILFYLAEKSGSDSLLPASQADRAEVLSWVFFQTGHLASPTSTVVKGLLMGMPYSSEAMEAAVEGVHGAFKLLEGRLSHTGAWLAAGRFTIADVAFISSVIFCKELLSIDLRVQYPSLAAWMEKAQARPAVRAGLSTPDANPIVVGGWAPASSFRRPRSDWPSWARIWAAAEPEREFG